MDGPKVEDFDSFLVVCFSWLSIKGHDRMYFSKLHKMFRIRYILRPEGSGYGWGQVTEMMPVAFLFCLLAYILACATEKNLLAISEFLFEKCSHSPHSGEESILYLFLHLKMSLRAHLYNKCKSSCNLSVQTLADVILKQ